jgi:hypothetical protein
MSCDYCWPGNCVGGPNCRRPPLTASISAELRALASRIEQMCMNAPCVNAALPVVQNCVDHLEALAAVQEKTLELAEREMRVMPPPNQDV